MPKSKHTDSTTHFGYRDVPSDKKAQLVGEVFSSVAESYDLMNDLMSMGVHRLWKKFAIGQSGLRPGQRILDIAGGSGDLAAGLAKQVGNQGEVVLADINAAMLQQGRKRMVDRGHVGNVSFVQADAEALAFSENYFDCISISFGLRNVTHIDRALSSMFQVLRPGGRLIILEFSRPTSKLFGRLYDLYSFEVIPRLGDIVANDKASYQYLVESIRKHPPQEELKTMMQNAGFEKVDYHNLTGGIVALHIGHKF
ncbi:bifunctional demethylmenaquinone methyltransferase/2-methoxy-6-polyprenyl-1,4-benzoquinol methylase UbiE [Pseudomonadota bacterium]